MTKAWGKELRRFREEKKWTQEQLLERLGSVTSEKAGRDASWVSKLEHGHLAPSPGVVIGLATAFDLQPAGKMSFILKATGIPEEVQDEIIDFYRQGFGTKVQEQLTELMRQMGSEHLNQSQMLNDLLQIVSQAVAQHSATTAEDEKEIAQRAGLAKGEEAATQLLQPAPLSREQLKPLSHKTVPSDLSAEWARRAEEERRWLIALPLAERFKRELDLHLLKAVHPDSRHFTEPGICDVWLNKHPDTLGYKCERCPDGTLLLHCPVDCEADFAIGRECFNDPQIWACYRRWQEAGGQLLMKYSSRQAPYLLTEMNKLKNVICDRIDSIFASRKEKER